MDARINACFRLTSGRWKCDCGRGRTFEIEGAEGLLACAVMAEVCPITDSESDPSCSPLLERSDTNSCELEEACGRSVDVTEVSGARAWLMEYGSAVCGRSDSRAPFGCSCVVGDVANDYGLLSESGDDACQPLLDFCRSGATPTYDGPTRCIDTAVEESVYGCLLNQACPTPMRLTDDVSLARIESWWSRCDPMSTGSRCYCSDENKGFEFDVTANPVSPTCASAMLNCTDFGNVERRGSVECQPNSQAAGLDYCNADLFCAQPATVNGRELVARGPMMILCRQRTAGQSWWCSCASNDDSAIFELGTPSATGWEACTAAIGRCENDLPFFIGPSGGAVYPPDPLPPE
jgi:hypothetical protein